MGLLNIPFFNWREVVRHLEDNNPFLLTWYLANLRHQLTRPLTPRFLTSPLPLSNFFLPPLLLFPPRMLMCLISKRPSFWSECSGLTFPKLQITRGGRTLELIQRNLRGLLSLHKTGKKFRKNDFVYCLDWMLFFSNFSFGIWQCCSQQAQKKHHQKIETKSCIMPLA